MVIADAQFRIPPVVGGGFGFQIKGHFPAEAPEVRVRLDGELDEVVAAQRSVRRHLWNRRELRAWADGGCLEATGGRLGSRGGRGCGLGGGFLPRAAGSRRGPWPRAVGAAQTSEGGPEPPGEIRGKRRNRSDGGTHLGDRSEVWDYCSARPRPPKRRVINGHPIQVPRCAG